MNERRGRYRVRRVYRAQDYDAQGNLTVPWWFWGVIGWLLMPWWLVGIGIAQNRPLEIADVIFPTEQATILGLVCGVPVWSLCFAYVLRGRFPRIISVLYILTLVVTLCAVGEQLWDVFEPYYHGMFGEDDSLRGCVVCFNLAALLLLLLSLRVWDVFFPVRLIDDNE